MGGRPSETVGLSELPQCTGHRGEGWAYGQSCIETSPIRHSKLANMLEAGSGGGVADAQQLLMGLRAGASEVLC